MGKNNKTKYTIDCCGDELENWVLSFIVRCNTTQITPDNGNSFFATSLDYLVETLMAKFLEEKNK